jgi:hypothetical protein
VIVRSDDHEGIGSPLARVHELSLIDDTGSTSSTRSVRAITRTGCPLPTISAELAARGQPSAESDRIVRDRLERIEQALSGDDATDAADASIALLSTLVGALQLSRSVADPALSDRILEGARRWLGRRFSS